MTKEELEKESEDNKPPYAFCALDTNCELWKDGYKKGSEPREKRIAELEATNKRISNECHTLVDTLEKKQKEITELEKENIELKKMYHESDEDNNKLRENIPILAEAKEIIKKLQFLYLNPVVTKDDVKRQDEILAEVKQFLKDSEVEK